MRGFAARVGWVVVGSLRMTEGTPLIVVKPTSQTGRGLATPVMIELASAFHPTRQWSAPSERTALGVRRDKAALSSGCKPHPAIHSSRKQPEQAWRRRNV